MEEIVIMPSTNGGSECLTIFSRAGEAVSGGVDEAALQAGLSRWQKWQASASGSTAPAATLEFAQIAEALSSALISAEVAAALQSEAKRILGSNRDIRLVVDCTDARFARVPWELVELIPSNRADPLAGCLGLQPKVHIVRRTSASQEPTRRKSDEIRVLTVAADPGTARFPRLSWVDKEIASIHSALNRPGGRHLVIRALHDAVPAVLERSLREFQPDIVHFAGHGELRPTGGVLILQGATYGAEMAVGADKLGPWLKAACVRLLVLSACNTAGSPNALAESLATQGIPAVVAMQSALGDACQPQFARTFYGALAEGASADEAISEARHALGGAATAWIAPVLYVAGAPSSPVPHQNRTSLHHHPNNLPYQSRPLISRELEVDTIVRQFADRRLFTITGPGGIGKTRLGLRAAEMLLPEFTDGAWIVQCDSCSSSDDLFAAIAGTLKLPGSESSVRDTVVAALQGQRMLLLLDCCEGLVASGSETAILDILAVKSISVLATSRIRLNLPEELTLNVGPLPDQEAGTVLFLNAAGIDRKSLSDSDVAAIRDINDALEGVPLALVLAAARLQILDVSQLGSLLRESTLKTIDGRDSTMSLAVRRSLDLVPEADRELLWRLCVFVGSFTWEDVLAVYPDDQFSLLDGLMRLTEGSLLQPVATGGGKRFRLLDPVREFMATVIQDDSASLTRLEARMRHASRFCAQAQTMSNLFKQGKLDAATALFWPNMGNYRAALAFSAEHRRFENVSVLAESLARTTMEAGLWGDFLNLTQEAYRAADELGTPQLTASLLGLEGAVAFRQGDSVRGRATWTRRAELCTQIGDIAGAADAIVDLAIQSIQDGHVDEGLRLLDVAEESLQAVSRPDLLATTAVIKGRTFARRGNIDDAREWGARADQLARVVTDRDPMLYVHTNLGRIWSLSGEMQLAENAYMKVIEDGTELGRHVQTGIACLELAQVHERMGMLESAFIGSVAAERLLEQARSRRRREAIDQLNRLSRTYPDRADWPEAWFAKLPTKELIREVVRRRSSDSTSTPPVA